MNTTYHVYQIQLTDEEIREVNKNGHDAVERNRQRIETTFGEWKPEWFASYEHVADIDADNLEHVFAISNLGDESRITRLASMHSLSVGDIVYSPITESHHIVASFGFKSLGRLN